MSEEDNSGEEKEKIKINLENFNKKSKELKEKEENISNIKKSNKQRKSKKKNKKNKEISEKNREVIKKKYFELQDNKTIRTILGSQAYIDILGNRVIRTSKKKKINKNTREKYKEKIKALNKCKEVLVLPKNCKYIKDYRVEEYENMGDNLKKLYIDNKNESKKIPSTFETIGQMILILEKFENNSIKHGDFKLDNCYIKGGKVMLGDFDNVSFINSKGEEEKSNADENPYHSSDEALSKKYDDKKDWYSVGVSMVELFTGRSIENLIDNYFMENNFEATRVGVTMNRHIVKKFFDEKTSECIDIKKIFPNIKDEKKENELNQLIGNFIKNSLLYPSYKTKASDLKKEYLKLINLIKEAGLDTGVSKETLNELSEKRQEKENNSEEQKNEKSANKISSMNFTKIQDYNENSRSLVFSDSSFFDSESENQKEDKKTEINKEEENLKLNNSSSFESEPELEIPSLKTENEGIGIGESLKKKLEKNKLDSDRLKTDEERIKLGTMTNDVRKIGNENEKITERSFS